MTLFGFEVKAFGFGFGFGMIAGILLMLVAR